MKELFPMRAKVQGAKNIPLCTQHDLYKSLKWLSDDDKNYEIIFNELIVWLWERTQSLEIF